MMRRTPPGMLGTGRPVTMVVTDIEVCPTWPPATTNNNDNNNDNDNNKHAYASTNVCFTHLRVLLALQVPLHFGLASLMGGVVLHWEDLRGPVIISINQHISSSSSSSSINLLVIMHVLTQLARS
jgi:hypothetical protein